MLNPVIVEAVRRVAIEDAKLFFDEFKEPIDTSATDWDVIAWEESQYVVKEIEGEDPNDYYQIYVDSLEAETERLSDEFDRQFCVETDRWSTKVRGYHKLQLCDVEVRFPILQVTAIDYSSDEDGIVDTPPTDEAIRCTLFERTNKSYSFTFGDWDGAEYPYIVKTVKVEPLSNRRQSCRHNQRANPPGLGGRLY